MRRDGVWCHGGGVHRSVRVTVNMLFLRWLRRIMMFVFSYGDICNVDLWEVKHAVMYLCLCVCLLVVKCANIPVTYPVFSFYSVKFCSLLWLCFLAGQSLYLLLLLFLPWVAIMSGTILILQLRALLHTDKGKNKSLTEWRSRFSHPGSPLLLPPLSQQVRRV